MLLDNKTTCKALINMNNIINKFLLAGDKFMPEMHLRQHQFVYSACGPFARHKERIKEFKRTGDTRLLYRNELDKVCFKHDAAYTKYKMFVLFFPLKVVRLVSTNTKRFCKSYLSLKYVF